MGVAPERVLQAEKRRQAELTMKREKALQHLDSQRLRAAEDQ